jgi:hypothetical protein
VTVSSAIFLLKKVPECRVAKNLVIPMPGKKVLERRSGLYRCEKELPDGVLARSVTKIPLMIGI